MSKIYADTIETENPNVDITLGAAGDAVLIPSGATLKTNTIPDAGGNNIFTSDGSGNLTVPSAFGGAMNLLATNTFTDQASSAFTTLIDSTYDVYIFKFIDINPATNTSDFLFNGSDDGGTTYAVTKTTTCFNAYNAEVGGIPAISYDSSNDLAQSTAYQSLALDIGNGADECLVGELYLFNPASTTLAKNFYSRSNYYWTGDGSEERYIGGYFNTTSAITAMNFKMDSGNMDGIIKMYGISKS